MRRMAEGNMRKAMMTWTQRIMLSMGSPGCRLAKVVWPNSVPFPSWLPWKFRGSTTPTDIKVVKKT